MGAHYVPFPPEQYFCLRLQVVDNLNEEVKYHWLPFCSFAELSTVYGVSHLETLGSQ